MSPAENPIAESQDPAEFTVLVVEDEVLLRLSIADYLRENGFIVIEAATADEGRSVLGAGVNVDLVFSDINMPGSMDGVGLAQWLGSHHEEIPVVLTSGVSSALTLAATAAPRVKAFVDKPYDHELLALRFRNVLAKRAKHSG